MSQPHHTQRVLLDLGHALEAEKTSGTRTVTAYDVVSIAGTSFSLDQMQKAFDKYQRSAKGHAARGGARDRSLPRVGPVAEILDALRLSLADLHKATGVSTATLNRCVREGRWPVQAPQKNALVSFATREKKCQKILKKYA